MKIAILMDDLKQINNLYDSTLALIDGFKKRGCQIFYFTADDLSLTSNDLVIAKVQNVEDLDQEISLNLTEVDLILIRNDPPFDMKYITCTYILEKIKDQVLILNDPSEIRNCPEKLLVMDFAKLMPKTLITSDFKRAEEFYKNNGDTILKPLYAFGGDDVFLVKKDAKNFKSTFDLLISKQQMPIIIQQFIKKVDKGDKRILLLNGNPVGCVNRIPKKGDIKSNLCAGGKMAKTSLTKQDQEICDIIGPILRNKKLALVGIDVIDGYLSEINVTSPTGIVHFEELEGKDLRLKIVDEMIDLAKNFSKKSLQVKN